MEADLYQIKFLSCAQHKNLLTDSALMLTTEFSKSVLANCFYANLVGGPVEVGEKALNFTYLIVS